jgi:hypothetical protein
MEGIEITHGSRVFIPVPCSTHIADLVYGFYREAKVEQGVELIDATEAGADDKGVEVELLHLGQECIGTAEDPSLRKQRVLIHLLNHSSVLPCLLLLSHNTIIRGAAEIFNVIL